MDDTGNALPAVSQLQLWRSARQGDVCNRSPYYVYRFVRLDTVLLLCVKLPETHYFLNREQGWIRLDSTYLGSDDWLLYWLRTDDTAVILDRGDTTIVDTLGGDLVIDGLVPLKAANAGPASPNFHLAWRNVYPLLSWGLALPRCFHVEVFWHSPGQDTAWFSGSRLLSEILGLTDSTGKPLLCDTGVYDFSRKRIHLPAFPDTVRGLHPFRNPALEHTVDDIYMKARREWKPTYVGQYEIVIRSGWSP